MGSCKNNIPKQIKTNTMKKLNKNKTISILDYTIHCINFNKTHKIRVEDLQELLYDLENNEIITLK